MIEAVQRNRRTSGLLAGVAALMLLLSVPPFGFAASAGAGSGQAARVAVGDAAIDFTMQSIDGETYRLSDLRGEKNVVIIFFRGTW